ncbi:MAG: tol-pal system-associated acyl-CoA thioesterase [Mariprofundaceae bacterium]
MPVRIYYEDTDHGGVVYYANYLKFMERGRTEFLRTAGIELDTIEKNDGVLFAVTEAHVRYHSPARFNDLLDIETVLTETRGARIAFRQLIRRASDQALLTESDIRLACMDRCGKVRRIPVSLRPLLQSHLDKSTQEQKA